MRAALIKSAKAVDLDGVVHGADRQTVDEALEYVAHVDLDAVLYALALRLGHPGASDRAES
jgi:hypothetical protein